MGGGTGPYVQGVMLKGGEEEGGGEEQEPPDPGEAGEADWEDMNLGEEDREAGRDAAGEDRIDTARRRQRNTMPGRGGGQVQGQEGLRRRSREPRTLRNCVRHLPAGPAPLVVADSTN